MPKDEMEQNRHEAYVWWNNLTPADRQSYTDSGQVKTPDDIVLVWSKHAN